MGYLRPSQRQDLESDKAVLENKMANPAIEDKAAVHGALQRAGKMLEAGTPPPLQGEALDKAVRRRDELQKQFISGMLSQEEMRKNPPGAVDAHRKWESHNKSAIMEWKDVQIAIDPQNEDRDLCNIERFRPTVSTMNMENAQIQGDKFFGTNPTPQYKEGWDEIWGDRIAEDDRLKAEMREKIDELSKQIEKSKKPRKRPAKVMACGEEVLNLQRKRHIEKCPKCATDART